MKSVVFHCDKTPRERGFVARGELHSASLFSPYGYRRIGSRGEASGLVGVKTEERALLVSGSVVARIASAEHRAGDNHGNEC